MEAIYDTKAILDEKEGKRTIEDFAVVQTASKGELKNGGIKA